jgi:hypothetical protein
MIFIDLGILLEVRFRLVVGMWGDGYTDIMGSMYVYVYCSSYLNPSFLTRYENIYLPTQCLLQILI